MLEPSIIRSPISSPMSHLSLIWSLIEFATVTSFEQSSGFDFAWVLVVFLAIVVLVLLIMLIRFRRTRPRSSPPRPMSTKPTPLDGYRQIFSRPTDPIGMLHSWRVRTTKKLLQHLQPDNNTTTTSQVISDDDKLMILKEQGSEDLRILIEGIQLVKNLEEHLRIHCGIVVVGSTGDIVHFDPARHKSQDTDLTPRAPVEVVSPGWRWRETPLRNPRVKRS